MVFAGLGLGLDLRRGQLLHPVGLGLRRAGRVRRSSLAKGSALGPFRDALDLNLIPRPAPSRGVTLSVESIGDCSERSPLSP